MPDNIFKGSPFGGRVPMSGAPGQPVPVVNGVPARPAVGQVPASQGFMPMAAAPRALPPVPGVASKGSPVPPPPAARPAAPTPPGVIPAGSKADCPVCRPFGRR